MAFLARLMFLCRQGFVHERHFCFNFRHSVVGLTPNVRAARVWLPPHDSRTARMCSISSCARLRSGAPATTGPETGAARCFRKILRRMIEVKQLDPDSPVGYDSGVLHRNTLLQRMYGRARSIGAVLGIAGLDKERFPTETGDLECLKSADSLVS